MLFPTNAPLSCRLWNSREIALWYKLGFYKDTGNWNFLPVVNFKVVWISYRALGSEHASQFSTNQSIVAEFRPALCFQATKRLICKKNYFKVSSRVKTHNFSKFAIFKWLNRANQELSFQKNSRKKCFFCADLWSAKVFSMLIILIDRWQVLSYLIRMSLLNQANHAIWQDLSTIN